MTTLPRLNERHRLIATLIAMGVKNTRIADLFGMDRQSISQIKRRPDVQDAVAIIQDQVFNESIEGFLGAVHAEAIPSVNKLRELRDMSEDEAIQRGAAKDLLNEYKEWVKPIALPKAGADDNTQRIPLPDGTLERLLQVAQAMDQPIDAEFQSVPPESGEEGQEAGEADLPSEASSSPLVFLQEKLIPKTVDEFIEHYGAREPGFVETAAI